MEALVLKTNRSVQLQQKAQRTSTTTTLGLVVSLRQTYRVEPRGLSSYLAGKKCRRRYLGASGSSENPKRIPPPPPSRSLSSSTSLCIDYAASTARGPRSPTTGSLAIDLPPVFEEFESAAAPSGGVRGNAISSREQAAERYSSARREETGGERQHSP